MHEDKLEAAISRGARADALMREEGGGWRPSSTIIVNVNLLANLSSRTQFSLCSEVCSVNISRPETDVADWSVHDPRRDISPRVLLRCGE